MKVKFIGVTHVNESYIVSHGQTEEEAENGFHCRQGDNESEWENFSVISIEKAKKWFKKSTLSRMMEEYFGI